MRRFDLGKIRRALRFYCITDDAPGAIPVLEQVRVALEAGATMIQYRNKNFRPDHMDEVMVLRDICRERNVPFIVNDRIELALETAADGVHIGQDDDDPAEARKRIGENAILGGSVSTPEELVRTQLRYLDYIGTGPVFATSTKVDAKPVIGLSGLERVIRLSSVPVVAIGGITAENAGFCMERGAAGVAVVSWISRSRDPATHAAHVAGVCGCLPRKPIGKSV